MFQRREEIGKKESYKKARKQNLKKLNGPKKKKGEYLIFQC